MVRNDLMRRSLLSSKDKSSAGVRLIIQPMCSVAKQLCKMIQIKAVTVLQDLIKSTEKVNKCFIAQILKFELRFRLLYF